MTEWIKCSDRLPNDYRHVLVTASGLIGFTFRNIERDTWAANVYDTDGVCEFYIDLHDPNCEYNIECTSKQITHWAELPAPPIELSENDKILIEEVQRNADCFARGVALGRQALGLPKVPHE